MYYLLRPLLFRLDPETAHGLTLKLLRLAGIFPPSRWLLEALYAVPQLPTRVFGLTFRNPVGLAAGYDKDALALRGLAALGFGHLEIGTVTPLPQAGNPKPRIFRLVEDEAIINRMGFPGQGAISVARRLTSSPAHRRPAVLGVNLGKNRDTPLEEAAADYLALLRIFAPLADYLVINVSSPNTVGLRRLQGRGMLEELLSALRRERAACKQQPPILVKLAPDMEDDELDDALAAITDQDMDGVIVTNTTLGRDGLHSPLAAESGGLSGRPLGIPSETVLGKVLKRLDGRLPVVSAGGIMCPADAKRRLELGAALVQVYTGLVYAGPGLVREIVRGL